MEQTQTSNTHRIPIISTPHRRILNAAYTKIIFADRFLKIDEQCEVAYEFDGDVLEGIYEERMSLRREAIELSLQRIDAGDHGEMDAIEGDDIHEEYYQVVFKTPANEYGVNFAERKEAIAFYNVAERWLER